MDEVEDQISIRCFECKEMISLSNSLADGWQMCQVCSNFFCMDCFREIIELKDKACTGSIGAEKHQIILSNIPREELLLFAEKDMKPQSVNSTLFEAFFEKRFNELTSTGTSLTEIKEQLKPKDVQDEGLAILRQERWRNQGQVLVQRRKGKYVTWESIGMNK